MEAVVNTTLSQKAKEDYELVQEAVAGCQRAYASLMNKYRHSIYRTMLKMVNHPEDAHDLTLEAFGKAFHHLHNYTPNYAFSTWLFKIAMNNGIDHIRKKRLKLLSIDDPVEPNGANDYAENLRSYTLDPEELVIREQRVDLMREVVKKLSLKYRLMIELRFFEEMSYHEISDELNIPLGTVKAQLFRAKEMLYELLQKPGAGAYLDSTARRSKN
jgi:RNA polymerase sigma-70 factor (ECF subfamily)